MDEFIMLSQEEMEELNGRTQALVSLLQNYSLSLEEEYNEESLDLSKMLMISALVSVIHRVYHDIPAEHHERLDHLLDFSGSNVMN